MSGGMDRGHDATPQKACKYRVRQLYSGVARVRMYDIGIAQKRDIASKRYFSKVGHVSFDDRRLVQHVNRVAETSKRDRQSDRKSVV